MISLSSSFFRKGNGEERKQKMAIKLKRPPQTKISNITYNNIIQDVYNLIQDNKELGDNWSDFISSDAGRMMTELFAWISERLGERIDSVGNELFLETAEMYGVFNMEIGRASCRERV